MLLTAPASFRHRLRRGSARPCSYLSAIHRGSLLRVANLLSQVQATEPAQHSQDDRFQGRPDSAKTPAGQQHGSIPIKGGSVTPFAAAQAQSAAGMPLQAAASAQQTPTQNGVSTPPMNGVEEQKLEPVILKKLLVANGILEDAAEKGLQRSVPSLASVLFTIRLSRICHLNAWHDHQ